MFKVAIVGTAPTSRHKAPFNDPSWEIWGQANPDLPRWSRWFELHDLAMIESAYPDLWAFLVGNDGSRTIYARAEDARIKGSVAFPRDKVLGRFGSHFLTSTVAWEMALALIEGADEISLYGIEMEADTEYAAQRPGCQHFISLAREIGVSVILPEGCGLAAPQPLYQLGDASTERRLAGIRAKRAALTASRAQHWNTADEARRQMDRHDGALEALTFVEQNWL